MDYEAMTTPQLQQECKRRGLPSGRAKAELVQRLSAQDAADTDSADDDFDDDGPLVLLNDGEHAVRPGEQVTAHPDLLPPAPEPFTPQEPAAAGPSTFRSTYQTGPGGLDETTHTELRQRARQDAIEAGHTPRGDAYRVGTTADGEVYEVNVRRRS